MSFLSNVWYAAAWSEDLFRALLPRTLLDESLVLFRDAARTPVALADVCPHRFAPLSRGKLIGSEVECGYHGLRFKSDGKCTHNPHGDRTARMAVRSYPVLERHGIIWVWMGAPDLADEKTVPDLGFMGPAPDRRTVHSYHLGRFPFPLLIDNLLDLSHSEYLHQDTFSGGAGEVTTLDAWEEEGAVVVERTQFRAPPPPRYRHVGESVDVTYRMRWTPSQTVAFDRHIRPAGRGIEEGVHSRFCHIATPRTAQTTHYFHAVTRTDDIDNESIDDIIRDIHAKAVVGEDVAMIEAIAQYTLAHDTQGLSPVTLAIDRGAMVVRSVMARLMREERGRGVP